MGLKIHSDFKRLKTQGRDPYPAPSTGTARHLSRLLQSKHAPLLLLQAGDLRESKKPFNPGPVQGSTRICHPDILSPHLQTRKVGV